MTNDSISREGGRFWKRPTIDDAEDNTIMRHIVKGENRIRRTSLMVESILSGLHVRPRTTTDSHNRANISAVNEAVFLHDTFPDRTILFASKDCNSKFNIRRKLEKICASWKRFLKRKDRDDICKKRKSCKKPDDTCQKRGEMCERKTTNCAERREQTCGRQATVLCSGRKSSSCGDKGENRDLCETRKQKCQKQSCTQRKDNDCRGAKKEDLCEKRDRAAPCKRQDSKEDLCERIEKDQLCRSAGKDVSCKQEKVCQKEEKKRADCADTKKVESCKKKECPPVKRAPGCTEDREKKKDC